MNLCNNIFKKTNELIFIRTIKNYFKRKTSHKRQFNSLYILEKNLSSKAFDIS